ncbi:MAG: hypothetical protein JXA54_02500 [Candidatus Heimdallarchaeota archaeon]|nr:hypothetical protein [Candidatus Heimdallarchaeota archaeon]
MNKENKIESTDDNLKELLDGMSIQSKKITQFIKRYEEKIQALEKIKEQNDQEIENLQFKIKEAQGEAESAKEFAKQAKDLKEKEFQPVIQELFERPKNELQQTISTQSKSSNRVTITVAVLSILITGLLSAGTIIYNSYSSYRTSRSINRIDENSSKNIKMLRALLPIEYKEKQIVDHLAGISRHFNDYSSKNKISLAFKMRVVGSFPPSEYELIQNGFKRFIDNNRLPSINEFNIWTQEIMALYNNHIQILEALPNKSSKLEEEFYIIKNFKLESDTTDYGNWYWDRDNTAEELITLLKAELQEIKEFYDLNEQSIANSPEKRYTLTKIIEDSIFTKFTLSDSSAFISSLPKRTPELMDRLWKNYERRQIHRIKSNLGPFYLYGEYYGWDIYFVGFTSLFLFASLIFIGSKSNRLPSLKIYQILFLSIIMAISVCFSMFLIDVLSLQQFALFTWWLTYVIIFAFLLICALLIFPFVKRFCYPNGTK